MDEQAEIASGSMENGVVHEARSQAHQDEMQRTSGLCCPCWKQRALIPAAATSPKAASVVLVLT